MNTYIHRVIHTLITSMKWNSWIIEHLFDNFVYGIETASLLITKKIPSLLDNAYIVIAYCFIAYKVIAYWFKV